MWDTVSDWLARHADRFSRGRGAFDFEANLWLVNLRSQEANSGCPPWLWELFTPQLQRNVLHYRLGGTNRY